MVLLFTGLICIGTLLLLLGKINTLTFSGGCRLLFPHCLLLPLQSFFFFCLFWHPTTSPWAPTDSSSPSCYLLLLLLQYLSNYKLFVFFFFYSIISKVITSFIFLSSSPPTPFFLNHITKLLILVHKLFCYYSFHFLFPFHSPCLPTSFYTLVCPWCLLFQLSEWSVFSAA